MKKLTPDRHRVPKFVPNKKKQIIVWHSEKIVHFSCGQKNAHFLSPDKILKKCNTISQILWHKIARPHRKLFGLFYPLETCFSVESFHS